MTSPNIPDSDVISLYSPVWRFLSTEHLEKLRLLDFTNSMMDQKLFTLGNSHGGAGLFPPQDTHVLGGYVGLPQGVVEQLSESGNMTLLLLHRDHRIAKLFGEHQTLSSCTFRQILEIVGNDYPQGPFNVVYSEGDRYVVYTPNELKMRMDVFLSGDWYGRVGYFKDPINLAVALAPGETPLGYLLKATDLDLVDVKDLSTKIIQQPLMSLGSDTQPVKLTIDELLDMKHLLELSYEDMEKLVETGDDVILLFAEGAAVQSEIIGDRGYGEFEIGPLLLKWMSPSSEDDASVIYFEGQSRIALTFDELSRKGDMLTKNGALVKLGEDKTYEPTEVVWLPHDLSDTNVERINEVLNKCEWVIASDVVQALVHDQWMYRVIVVPNIEMVDRNENILRSKMEELGSELAPVFIGSPFSLRVEQSWHTTSRAVGYAGHQELPPAPGLGL